jgi:hypothetical protein
MAFVVTTGDFTTVSASTTIAVDAPASIAVDNLLIAHIQLDAEQAINSVPTGWTLLENEAISTSIEGSVYYKVAVIGDVGVASYSWGFDSGTTAGGIIMKITGAFQNTPIATNNSGQNTGDTVATVSTVTPSIANSGFLVVGGFYSNGEGRTTASYAMATSDPSWSELYDTQYDTNGYQMFGAFATRAAATATGNITATASGSDPNYIAVIVINPREDVTVSPDALALTATLPASSLLVDSTIMPDALALTATIPDPAASGSQMPAFSNPAKTPSTWQNTPKS